MKWLIPRITTADRTALTLDVGDLVYDTDLDSVWVGDGATAGGNEITGGGGGGGVTDGDKGDIVVSGSGAVWNFDSGVVTAFARTILDDANAAAVRTTLALGALATKATIDSSALIDNDIVTYAKLQNVSATNRILGRITAGAGDPEELTAANVRTIINVEDGATADQTAAEILAALLTVDGSASGLDADKLDGTEGSAYLLKTGIASGTITARTDDINFNGGVDGDVLTVQADGSLALETPAVGGVSDGDKGNITVSSGGTVWTIDNDVVTFAKMQNITTDRILGRDTAASGDVEELTLSAVLDFVGSAAQGDILYRGASTWTRLGAGTSGQLLQTQGAAANPQWATVGTLTDGDKGDITVSGSGATWTIDADAVTFAKIQNITTDRILGRDTAGSGDMEELTLSAVLDFVGSAAQGDILYRGASTWTRLGAGTSGQLLQTQGAAANPQWATVGTLTDGDKGDITVSASGATWTVDADVVTFAKMQNIATDRLLGRDTAATGDPEEISVGGGLEFTGSAGIQRSALTGDVTASAGSNSTVVANNAISLAKLADIATDRLIGRDTAATGDPEELTVTGGLEFTGSGGIQRSALTGDVTASAGSNATTIATGAVGNLKLATDAVTTVKIQDAVVTNAKLADAGALSVLGRSANSTGVKADISASAASGAVLRESGSTIGWGTIATAGIANDAVTYAKIQNVSATDMLLGRSTAGAGDVEEIPCTAAGRALLDDAAASNQRTTLGLGSAALLNMTVSSSAPGSPATGDLWVDTT